MSRQNYFFQSKRSHLGENGVHRFTRADKQNSFCLVLAVMQADRWNGHR